MQKDYGTLPKNKMREKLEQWLRDNFDLSQYTEDDTFRMTKFMEQLINQVDMAVPTENVALISWSNSKDKWRVNFDSGEELYFDEVQLLCKCITSKGKIGDGSTKNVIAALYNRSVLNKDLAIFKR